MAKGTFFPVQFSGNRGVITCDEVFQKNEPASWNRYLRHSHQNRKTVSVTCLCQLQNEDRDPLRLKVSHSEASDRYWLSAWPYEGHRHSDKCRFFSIWSDKNQAGIYADGVVTLGADGLFKIRLPTGLQKKEPRDAAEEVTEKPAKKPVPGKRKPTMKLLGLLHFMWDKSGINVWHPAFEENSPRNSLWLGNCLNDMSKKIRAGKTVLNGVMLIPGQTGGKYQMENLDKFREATKNNKRMVVVSQLASWTEKAEERFRTMLPLGLFGGFPELLLTADVIERCNTSYSRELGHWRRGARVMVIAETEPPVTTFTTVDNKNIPSTRSEVIDIALMVVSPRYIPMDSGYEAVIEAKLWAEKRAFIKPLRYDGEEDVFPDFLLTDVSGRDFVPLEVFGMNTPEYKARKAIKQDHYAKEYGDKRWWSWDATLNDAESLIPAFPAKN